MPVLRGVLFFDRREKKARVDKNKKQNLQNQRRAMKESLSTVGSTVMDPRVRKTKTQAEAAYDIARTATASVGKFDDQTQVGTHPVVPSVPLWSFPCACSGCSWHGEERRRRKKTEGHNGLPLRLRNATSLRSEVESGRCVHSSSICVCSISEVSPHKT
eukprot:SAG25_NODE_5677_length_632_cov_1.335835_1_plen_158_part_10